MNEINVEVLAVCTPLCLVTLRAAQCIVIGPVCVCVAGGRCLQLADGVCGGRAGDICYHDNSKLRASIFTKLGL